MVRAESLPQRGAGRDERSIDGVTAVVNGQPLSLRRVDGSFARVDPRRGTRRGQARVSSAIQASAPPPGSWAANRSATIESTVHPAANEARISA